MEVKNVAVFIAQDLDFYVAGAADVAFQKDSVVAESGGGFFPCLFKTACKFFCGIDHAHAPATAAKSCFHHERKADFVGLLESFRGIDHRFFRAGYHGNACALCKLSSFGFITKSAKEFRSGTDKRNTGLLAGDREVWIFTEEAIPGMNVIDFFFFGQGNDAFDVQVGLDGSQVLAGLVGFVRFESVEAEAVFFRIDGNRAKA